jgi:hypothetical protein
MEKILAILVILVAVGLVGLSIFGPKNYGGTTAFDKEATIKIDPGRKFDPDRITMSSGRVKISITNTNNILHQIVIYDNVEQRIIAQWDSIKPGATETQWVELVRGRRYDMYDPTWKDKGMKAVLIAGN